MTEDIQDGRGRIKSFHKQKKPFALERQKTENALFEFCKEKDDQASMKYLLEHVELSGLRLSDPRLQPLMTYLESVDGREDFKNIKLDIASFSKSMGGEGASTLIHQAINKQLVIPDFQEFTEEIKTIFTDQHEQLLIACSKNSKVVTNSSLKQLF